MGYERYRFLGMMKELFVLDLYWKEIFDSNVTLKICLDRTCSSDAAFEN